MTNDPPALILASASPRRQELLRRCGREFTVKTAEVMELTDAQDLASLPEKNAVLKAGAVADRYPDAWVLGADTMIIFEDKAAGKPRDLADAARMLREFSGKSHRVITGIALICRQQERIESWSEVSTVKFRELTEKDIARYLELVPVLDKAGAYAIQEYGEMIVESFSGELENIIGLPVKKLTGKLMEIYG